MKMINCYGNCSTAYQNCADGHDHLKFNYGNQGDELDPLVADAACTSNLPQTPPKYENQQRRENCQVKARIFRPIFDIYVF